MNRASKHSFTIDQALHGYKGGHRLLAISRKLNGHNQHAALQLSDRAVPSNYLPPSGYLTGYPFPDDGVYVFSRTWAAPEMDRPGCVWTHSLLIAFTDLAQINDIIQLTALFQKPGTSQDHSEYVHPLEFKAKPGFLNPKIELPLARSIITALYGAPDEQIFLTVEDQAAAEATVMAIWSQQWPRLRRGFRFCTLTFRDRSTADHLFDLQLRSSRFERTSLWPEGRQATSHRRNTHLGAWVEICLQDLGAKQHPLRDFLRRAGGDLTGGRSRFAELCELYGHPSTEKEVLAVERTLDYVEHRLSPNEGRLLRKATIEDAIHQITSLSDHSLVTILPYLQNGVTSFSEDTAAKVARRYWAIDPNILLEPATPSAIRKVLGPIIKEMTLTDALEIMRRSEKLFEAVLKVQPEVLTLPQIWHGESDDILIDQLKRTHAKSLKRRILRTVISAQRRDLAQVIVDWMGSELLLDCLITGTGEIDETGIHFLSESLARSTNAAGIIGKYLLDVENPLPKRMIHAFTNQVYPSDVVNSKKQSIDPWAAAWAVATGDLDAHSTDAVHIFFIERAFHLASPASAALLVITFDPLYDRLSHYAINYDNRDRVSRYLSPWTWWDWSYEGRFMRAVAKLAIIAKLPEPDLLNLTRNDQRLVALLGMITEAKGGRQYLRMIKRGTRDSTRISKLRC